MTEGIIDLLSLVTGGVAGLTNNTDPYVPLSFPLDVPNAGITSVVWQLEQVRGVSESPFSLHRQVFKHAGERWRATVLLSKCTREMAAGWRGLLLALDGGYGTFRFGDPFDLSPRGVAYGSPKVEGAGQTGKVLVTSGWNANVANILRAGDRIQVGDGLHEIVRDTNSDAAGQATLDIWPRIRTSPGDQSAIITYAPKGLFQLASPNASLYALGINGAYEVYGFNIVEAF